MQIVYEAGSSLTSKPTKSDAYEIKINQDWIGGLNRKISIQQDPTLSLSNSESSS